MRFRSQLTQTEVEEESDHIASNVRMTHVSTALSVEDERELTR